MPCKSLPSLDEGRVSLPASIRWPADSPQPGRFFLPVELAKEFEERSVKLSAKNRVYCHDPRCSTFLPLPASVERMEGEWLTCPVCEKTTCTICKAAAHTGDCPDDTALQQLLDTAGNEQWQRCYQCHRFVELEQGCNHMTYVPSRPIPIQLY